MNSAILDAISDSTRHDTATIDSVHNYMGSIDKTLLVLFMADKLNEDPRKLACEASLYIL